MAIKDINPATPGGNDLVLNGDDQIREFKQDVRDTFPELADTVYEDADTTGQNGTVPVSNTTMSSWEARIKALEAIATSPDGTSIPVGGVIAWYGNINTIPVGFKICDGQTHQYTDGNGDLQSITVPDLRGRFIMGMGWTGTNWNDTGGLRYTNNEQVRNTATVSGHTHSTSTPGHALGSAQMPAHGHGIFGSAVSISGGNPPTVGFLEYAAVKLTNPSGSFGYSIAKTTGAPSNGATSLVGSGQAHTHPSTTSGTGGSHNHEFNATQPFCALYYICYVAA